MPIRRERAPQASARRARVDRQTSRNWWPRPRRTRLPSGEQLPRSIHSTPICRRPKKPGLAGFLEMLQRRLAATTRVDEFGCDPLYGAMWWPIFKRLYRNYWRVETTGVENVPEHGRAMIVANHSGGSYAWDAVMISTAIHLEHPRPRMVRYVIDRILLRLSVSFLRQPQEGRRAGLPRGFRPAARARPPGRRVPGGREGVPQAQRSALSRAALRTRRLRAVALATRSPIMPVAVVGGEEIHFSLGNSRTARQYRQPADAAGTGRQLPAAAQPASAAGQMANPVLRADRPFLLRPRGRARHAGGAAIDRAGAGCGFRRRSTKPRRCAAGCSGKRAAQPAFQP